MQGHSMQPNPNTRIPYSRWAQHRAANGLIYLSHPITGEVKWLWSRHRDPKTSSDYLVNTITGDRQWVTQQNQHLCPTSNRASTTTSSTKTKPTATNPFSETPKPPPKVHIPAKPATTPPNAKYREIEAPKSLGLTADEVLMVVPETGRRYIYNRKTRSSRWLLDRPPDQTTGQDAAGAKMGVKATGGGPSGQSSGGFGAAGGENKGRRGGWQGGRAGATGPGYGTGRAGWGSEEAVGAIQRVFRGVMERRVDVVGKLRLLQGVVEDVERVTGEGKYDMSVLRRMGARDVRGAERQEGRQRLLELGEYLTQKMLKLDDVESGGREVVRARRKKSVKLILGLTEEVDSLRRKLGK
eukprot:GFKZ01009859.1.p1 GENE.GFKZ01009859.1~~GFKZ01009859.1.p1  ORF type:complete len:354 (-),score=43.06 GFKZ01009859.1:301-1362(-)